MHGPRYTNKSTVATEKRQKRGSLNILGSLLATHQYGKELLMEKTNLASSIYHVDVNQCVESNALVFRVELAMKSIAGVQRAARIGSTGTTMESSKLLTPTATIIKVTRTYSIFLKD